MYYVYILKLNNGNYYVGRSNDLRRRIKEHQNGESPTTSKYLPCNLITYIAFENKTKAVMFERYLKTGSGLAFRKRHLV